MHLITRFRRDRWTRRSPILGGAFLLLGINVALGALCYALLKSGWKLKA